MILPSSSSSSSSHPISLYYKAADCNPCQEKGGGAAQCGATAAKNQISSVSTLVVSLPSLRVISKHPDAHLKWCDRTTMPELHSRVNMLRLDHALDSRTRSAPTTALTDHFRHRLCRRTLSVADTTHTTCCRSSHQLCWNRPCRGMQMTWSTCRSEIRPVHRPVCFFSLPVILHKDDLCSALCDSCTSSISAPLSQYYTK